MAATLKLGDRQWATKEGSLLAYNDENNNFKPLPFDFTRASSATRVNKQGLIETVASGVPRIDYTDANGALLLEPQRTNLVTYSEDFSSWGVVFAGTGIMPIIQSDVVISPDGTQNADKFIFDTNGGTTSGDYSFTNYSYTSTVNDYSLSIYLKGNVGGEKIFMDFDSGNSNIITLTNTWERYTLTKPINNTATKQIRIGQRGGTGSDLNESIIYIWGAQLEEGSYATSYIPTQGSAVTVVKDICTGAGNDQVFNSEEGVLYIETKGFIDVPTTSSYIQLSKNGESSATNSLIIQHRNNGYLRIYVNGFGNDDIHFNVNIDFTENHKIAVLYKLNGYKLFIDGVAQSLYGTPTQTVFSGLDNLSFDLRGASVWTGNVKDARVYNTALTDAELIALTTI